MIANDATEAPTGTSSLHLAARRACLPGQARVTPGTLGAETPAEVVTEAEQMPRRARYLVPRGLPRRDEVLAVCVVAVVLVHLLFAQLTIILATVLYLIDAQLSRVAESVRARGFQIEDHLISEAA